MKIGGFLKFSTLDYPGKISAVVFTQGCPLRCVYCHNADFQDASSQGSVAFSEVLEFSKTRVGMLDAVVFSGGEPLLQPDLKESMRSVKGLGFQIGLHTSGAIPEKFAQILDIVDWVGFDIKTSFDKYNKITGVPGSGELAMESLLLLIKSGVDYELRTTFDSRNISEDDLLDIAKILRNIGATKWVLQECILRKKDGVDEGLLLPDSDTVSKLSEIISVDLRRE